MKQLVTFLTAGVLAFITCSSYAQKIPVGHFNKVIISPYIQVTFIQGDQESVTINDIIVDSSKLHVEVHHGTLRIYLEGAKDIPRHQQNDKNEGSHALYPNHAVFATVVYNKMDALSLRGSETYLCESSLSADDFTLRIYGEARVIFTEVHMDKMHSTIYGQSSLDIKGGTVNEQYYTCYGESKVNTTAISGFEAKLTAYGESEFAVNVSDRIRINSFGESKLRYKGTPTIVKGIHIGEMDLKKLD